MALKSTATRLFQSLRRLEQGSFSISHKKSFHLACIIAAKSSEASKPAFDTQMLEILACPLSKKPLRYDAENNELICDDLGVAYPIVNGIPNLNPQDGRMIKDISPEATAEDNK